MNKQKTKALAKARQAFTLVELIVVITILAILGTIAFISLQGYSKSARDAKRIADVQNIKKSLELFILNTGVYPIPDDGGEVSYSGELVRTQGIVGNIVTRNLSKNLNKKPLDPLLEIEYTYSVSNFKKEYEVLALYEGDFAYNNILNNANAANKYTPKISGNYNGLFIKTVKHIVPTPSIINAEVGVGGLILDEDNIKSQIVSAGENFPNVNAQTKTGSLNIKLSPHPLITSESGPADKVAAIEAIQNAYSGSTLADDDLYVFLLSKTSFIDKYELVEKTVLDNDGELDIEVIDGECGNDDGQNKLNTPTNLCIKGISSSVTDNGIGDDNYIWTCDGIFGGTQDSCTANHVILVNGECGSDDGGDFTVEPTNLCNNGIPTPVTDNGIGADNYIWICNGENGGTPDSCTANHVTIYPGCNGADITVGSYIISACNVGSTQAGTTEVSYGNYYQFGKTDTTFTPGSSGDAFDWISPGGADAGSAKLWGISEGENLLATYLDQGPSDKLLMKGPCATGYHIPTHAEWTGIISAGGFDINPENMKTTLKLPGANYRMRNNRSLNIANGGYFWSSSPGGGAGYFMGIYDDGSIGLVPGLARAYGLSVRCIKDY